MERLDAVFSRLKAPQPDGGRVGDVRTTKRARKGPGIFYHILYMDKAKLEAFISKNRVLPFGTHKDKDITKAPSPYVEWVAANFRPGRWKTMAILLLYSRGVIAPYSMNDPGASWIVLKGRKVLIGREELDYLTAFSQNEVREVFESSESGSTVLDFSVLPEKELTFQQGDPPFLARSCREFLEGGGEVVFTGLVKGFLGERFAGDLIVLGDLEGREPLELLVQEVLSLGAPVDSARDQCFMINYLRLRWVFRYSSNRVELIELEDLK